MYVATGSTVGNAYRVYYKVCNYPHAGHSRKRRDRGALSHSLVLVVPLQPLGVGFRGRAVRMQPSTVAVRPLTNAKSSRWSYKQPNGSNMSSSRFSAKSLLSKSERWSKPSWNEDELNGHSRPRSESHARLNSRFSQAQENAWKAEGRGKGVTPNVAGQPSTGTTMHPNTQSALVEKLECAERRADAAERRADLAEMRYQEVRCACVPLLSHQSNDSYRNRRRPARSLLSSTR